MTDLIKSRRSVYPKDFDQSKKIKDSVITQILELAVFVPNHGLTQPWFF
ncbi:MAG: hypothetical protein HC906_13210 [Bacteroidales bacterium]|nr:hypothetical protein [Bacteroidales bacterium]